MSDERMNLTELEAAAKTGEIGPLYGVELIDTLPLKGGMLQQMPSRADLEYVVPMRTRVVAGYEVLLAHYLALIARVRELEAELLAERQAREPMAVIRVQEPSALTPAPADQPAVEPPQRAEGAELPDKSGVWMHNGDLYRLCFNSDQSLVSWCRWPKDVNSLRAEGCFHPKYLPKGHWSQPDARAECERLREWKTAVLQAVRNIPEYGGPWAGDKDGWGFAFEVISWQTREVARLRSEIERLRAEIAQVLVHCDFAVKHCHREGDSGAGYRALLEVQNHVRQVLAALQPPTTGEQHG